jgi:copper chaperone
LACGLGIDRDHSPAKGFLMETLVLPVAGMTCGGCVRSVERVLAALPGVSQVAVSLEKGEASVQLDPVQSSREVLAEAVRNAGFEVQDA